MTPHLPRCPMMCSFLKIENPSLCSMHQKHECQCERLARVQKVDVVMKEFENIIFPSKEGPHIEHVDEDYHVFMNHIRKALTEI